MSARKSGAEFAPEPKYDAPEQPAAFAAFRQNNEAQNPGTLEAPAPAVGPRLAWSSDSAEIIEAAAQPDEILETLERRDGLSFSPPNLRSDDRTGRFGPGVAWMRGGALPGGFVAAWPGAIDGAPGRAHEINVQFYDSDGRVAGDEIRAAQLAAGAPATAPQLAALDEGRVAIAWSAPSELTDALSLRIFQADASVAPTIITLATPARWARGIGQSAIPRSIARLKDGGFVLAWSLAVGQEEDRRETHFVQFFAPDGRQRSPASALPAPANLSGHGSGAIVAWATPDLSSIDDMMISIARFDADGATAGPTLDRLAPSAAEDGVTPLELADGGFAALWRSASACSLRGQRFSPNAEPIGGQFTLPRGAVDAENWGLDAGLELTTSGVLNAFWIEGDGRKQQPVQPTPANAPQRWPTA
ncbi:MAG: hypothetical protein MRY74_07505 [Neomegalonema sp.]|nr:hypothetical protein [Neomegalonema sp.]